MFTRDESLPNLMKVNPLVILLKFLSHGLSLEDARDKLAKNNLDEFRIKYDLSGCSCNKKECLKCFYWALIRQLNSNAVALDQEENANTKLRALIDTHYYHFGTDGVFKKVGTGRLNLFAHVEYHTDGVVDTKCQFCIPGIEIKRCQK